MRTSIDLPDALFREAKARAARRGVSLRELVTRALERELSRTSDATTVTPPLVRSTRRTPLRLSNERIEELLG